MPHADVIFEEKMLTNKMREINIFSKKGQKFAFIQFTSKIIDDRSFIEIDQVYTNPAARGNGYASKLVLKIFAKAISEKTDIRLQIQPGSALFYQKFFRQYFSVKTLRLFGGEKPMIITSRLKDGCSIDVSYEQLASHYKTQEKNRDMERALFFKR